MAANKAPATSTDFTPIAAADFRERTGVDLAGFSGCEAVQWIVSPRDIRTVSGIIVMPDAYRDRLLSSVGVAYDRDRKIYKELEVRLRMIDPSDLLVGQKYVYRPNYIAIVEGFRDLFRGFGITRGFTRLSAFLIIGKSKEGYSVLGHYLPPIVENYGAERILMDGVHRNYLSRAAGVSIECIEVRGVKMTFPCSPHHWSDVEVTDRKPPKAEDRYWDLDRNLFRDLKYAGIDG